MTAAVVFLLGLFSAIYAKIVAIGALLGVARFTNKVAAAKAARADKEPNT